jgi:DNA-binding CsgD family transcriptional regulator
MVHQPEAHVYRQQLLAAVATLWTTVLSEVERDVLMWRVEGCTLQEIATRKGVSVKRASDLVARARGRLRKKLYQRYQATPFAYDRQKRWEKQQQRYKCRARDRLVTFLAEQAVRNAQCAKERAAEHEALADQSGYRGVVTQAPKGIQRALRAAFDASDLTNYEHFLADLCHGYIVSIGPGVFVQRYSAFFAAGNSLKGFQHLLEDALDAQEGTSD